jgi:hypothetical protein
MGGETQIVLAMVAIAGFAASIAYWRAAVAGALLLLVFEGALRKWVFPEAQAALYIAKDVLLLGAYVGFFATQGVRLPARQAAPFAVLLALTIGYGTAQILNPALPSFTLALVGWRAYFFYVPLVLIVPYLFPSLEGLERALQRYALLAAAVAALGILQFYSPADSFLNANVQHAPGERVIVGFGYADRVRVSGTFAFISGFAAYLLAAGLLLGALLAVGGWRIRRNAMLYAALALVVIAAFTTGSRAPVYSLAIAALAYIVFSTARGDLAFAAGARAAVVVVAMMLGSLYFLSEPTDAFRYRVAGADDPLSRLTAPLIEPFYIPERAGALGFGIGAAHQSAVFLAGSAHSWWTDGLVVEAETSRVMLELGVPGFLLVFLFRVLIALAALRAALLLKSRTSRTFALALALYLGLQIFGAVIFNPTNDLLYWFAVGILFALHRLDARQAGAAAAQRALPRFRELSRPA